MTLTQTATQPSRRKGRLADMLVMTAMGVTAVALAVGLVLQVGLTFWLAISTAVLAYVTLLTLHAFLRRSARLDDLEQEVDRLEQEIARLGGRAAEEPIEDAAETALRPAGDPGAGHGSRPHAGQSTAGRPESSAGPASAPPAPDRRATGDVPPAGVAGGPALPRTATLTAPQASPSARPSATPAAGETRTTRRSDVEPSSTAQVPSEPVAGGGAQSPSRGRPGPVGGGAVEVTARAGSMGPPQPPVATHAAASAAGAAREGATARAGTGDAAGGPQGAPREVDVEMIQRLIKKLADEVNAVGTQQQISTPDPASGTPLPEQAIAESLSALRQTADAMRARPPQRAPGTEGPSATPHRAKASGSAGAPPAVAPSAGRHAPTATASAVPETDVEMLLSRAHSIAGGPLTPGGATPSAAPALPAGDRAVSDATRTPAGPPDEASARERRAQPAAWTPAPRIAAPEPAPEPFWPAVEPAPAPLDPRLAEVSSALSEGRVEVLLEPILALDNQRASHYEVSVRLKTRSGAPLETGELRQQLRGAGLLPLLDGVSVRRTGNVARRLEARGKAGAVFSQLSGESLVADSFLSDFAETYQSHEGSAAQLVLTFAQSDVRGFGVQEWATLADMRELGFRFALRAVTDLDMDFDALCAAGFAFAKLDASVLLEGLPAPGGHVPAGDICRHLAALGLTLIVEEIDDEAVLARILGFGALLGQGRLFGGPRPVKPEVANAPRTAAA